LSEVSTVALSHDELDAAVSRSEADGPQPSPAVSGQRRGLLVLFTATSFVASMLVFSVQPLVGRLLLPLAGGSAGLWNTALVFFQAVLLAGYLLAHFSSQRLAGGRHLVFQLGLLCLPLLVLPLSVPAGWDLTSGSPVVGALAVLTLMVGLPFLALSTASPTLQRWFSQTDHPDAGDPYFLYAAGNVGSMIALLGYPLVLEPMLGLKTQTQLFAGVYLFLLVLFAACAWSVRGSASVSAPASLTDSPVISWAQRGRWVGLAALPSALLLGVTRYIATDVASFPLLWIVPLVLYLLTFVIAFGRPSPKLLGIASSATRLLGVGLVITFVGQPLVLQLAIHLSWFFAATLLCHLRLAADRPDVARLTEFYAWISTGGVIGGATVALLAPIIFNRVWEYPLAIVAATALTIGAVKGWGGVGSWIAIGAAAGAGLYFQMDSQVQIAALCYGIAGIVAFARTARPEAMAIAMAAMLGLIVAAPSGDLLFRDRSFFGTYAVVVNDDGAHQLIMGTTLHGRQRLDEPNRPTSYYHPAGPLGSVFGRTDTPQSVVVIGLGAGEIAAYGQAGDQFTFVEIDPKVVEIAENTELFTFLADSPADLDVIVGDGRIELQKLDGAFDIVVVDAFSSDSIPVHLLTLEAVAGYVEKAPEGLVAIHVSNRHFDLQPVLAGIAQELGTTAWSLQFSPDQDERATGATASTWVVLDPGNVFEPDARWNVLGDSDLVWTDDYANLLEVFSF
jgi:hypothetical protein